MAGPPSLLSQSQLPGTTREMLTSVLSARHEIVHTCNMKDLGASHLLYCHGPTEYSSLLETSTLPFPLTI